MIRAYINENRTRFMEEWASLIRIPSVSCQPAHKQDMLRCAERWCELVLNDHLKLQLNGGVQNIFNAFQKDLDKGGSRDSKYFYGPTQPRTYFVGIKFFN